MMRATRSDDAHVRACARARRPWHVARVVRVKRGVTGHHRHRHRHSPRARLSERARRRGAVGRSVGRSVERTRGVVTTRRTGMMGGDERRDARARDTRVTSAWRAA
jgi:hypothetical protein